MVDPERQAMQTARMELKLSQKDVAQKINEKPSVLQDYEAGKAIPNAQILSKLERVLGVKLRGTSPFLFNPFSLTYFLSR
jgi:putative transcription factor